MFGRGLGRAIELRAALLEALGAELEWTFGAVDDETVVWLAGPLATRFVIEPVVDDLPGLGILQVFTVCASVGDVAAARAAVHDLNFHTSVNRWQILNDPGPEGWWNPSDVSKIGRSSALTAPYDPEGEVSVALGASFVVGDSAHEVPFAAMVTIVREQIAKATAVATNGFSDGWGETAVVEGPNGWRRPSEWNRAVYFYDDVITPRREDSPGSLLTALVEAFESERDRQFRSSPAAWFGNGDASGFTCEVPYGPGPYPVGVVGMRSAMPHLSSRDNETALVRGLIVDNPHLGRGLLVTMELPNHPDQGDPDWWTVHLLNAQNKTRANGATPGFAHGLGAWVERPEGPTHVCFIPTGWSSLLDHADLVQFFAVLLGNAARLSWGSRRILEAPTDWPHFTPPGEPPRPLHGLAAGAAARGDHFGEPGCGQDWGALVLDDAWRYLVANDVQWARRFDDVAGFRFWTGPAVIDMTARDCGCNAPGSVIDIETVLGRPSAALHEQLATQQQSGVPMAFAMSGDSVAAWSSMHVHHDSLTWARAWATALATAQAALADSLGDPGARGVDLRLPEGEVRPDRDQMLELWTEPDGFVSASRALAAPAELLSAVLLAPNPGFDATWEEPNLTLRWHQRVEFRDDSSETHVVSTTLSYVDHPTYGRSLRLSSVLGSGFPASQADALALNGNDAVRGRSTFTLGGFHPHPDGLGCTSLYPLALDRSDNREGQAAFAGTAWIHHQELIAFALTRLDGVAGSPLPRNALTTGVANLLRTYQTVLGTPSTITAAVTEQTEDRRVVTWERPWPYSNPGEWPQLAAPDTSVAGPIIRGSLSVDLWSGNLSSLRLLHAAFAVSAPRSAATGRAGVAVLDLAEPPSSDEWAAILGHLVETGYAYVNDGQDEGGGGDGEESDGEAYLVLGESTPPTSLDAYMTDEHLTWGEAMVLDVTIPANGVTDTRMLNEGAGIGAWSLHQDLLTYRLCLPTLSLACLYRSQVLSDIAYAATLAIGQVQGATSQS